MEWTGLVRRDDRRPLKQIFQVVVQPANHRWLPGSAQLSFDVAIIGAAAHLDAKLAEAPQLPSFGPRWGTFSALV